MKINFFGNGSGFSKTHTGAFFEHNNDLIIIDCSMLNINNILKLDIEKYKNIFLYITHMHDDHVSGVTLLIQYLHYVYYNDLTLVIPEELKSDILIDFKIKGIPDNIYKLELCDEFNPPFFIKKIKTSHAPELEGKCFGYVFFVDNVYCVYSGDTNTINPYINYIMSKKVGTKIELYLDVSANYGSVHLKYSGISEYIEPLAKTVPVYIMHIDNEEAIKNLIKDTNVKIAEIYKF